MNKYPRSIRYAISTCNTNNSKYKRNTSESQRMISQDNILMNPISKNTPLYDNENDVPNNLYNQNRYHKPLYSLQKTEKILNEDYKNKTEARQLIEQTKKMMEEYSINKLKANKTMSNFGYNNITDDNNNNKSAILHRDRLDQLAGTTNSIDNLTQKLICKNKEIKVLERELKERTNQLKAAQDKISSKNEEIKKMLEILDVERSNSLKVENAKLNKKIFNLEKSNNDTKKNCERNIEDLKIKINDLNKQLINYQNRNRELENNNLILREDNEKLRNLLEQKNNLNLTLNEKNEIEKKSNEANNLEIQNLKNNLSNIIIILKTLYNKESQVYEKRNIFLKKLNNLNTNDDTKEEYNRNYSIGNEKNILNGSNRNLHFDYQNNSEYNEEI